MNDNKPMRNPIGQRASYQEYLSEMEKCEKEGEAHFSGLPPPNKTCFMYSSIGENKKFLLHQYGAGFALEAIISTLKILVPRILDAGDYVRGHREPPQFQDDLLWGTTHQEKLDSPPWFGGHSCDLADEIALAACLYDIDDTPFRDHPYYPRDLADYYRQHIGHSRDQWRPLYVGAGLPITVPPPLKKADLAKSKRQGIARWVELVADGDIDATEATEAILEATGKPRKIHDLQTLLQHLAESDLAIYADLKDDETLEQQAGELSEKRALGPFEGPPGPPYGPARCEATLMAWSAWLAERGYLLVDIHDEDSDWHAVLVNTSFHPELHQLSEQLGIPVRLHGADRNPHQE